MFQCPAPIVNVPPPPPSHDFRNTVVSICVGIVLGFISALIIEPAKVARLRNREAKTAENGIYIELGGIYAAITAMLKHGSKDAGLIMSRIKFYKLDYYYDEKRDVFYAMRDAEGIERLNRQLRLLMSEPEVKKRGPAHQMQEVLDAIDYSIKVGEVDGERVEAAKDAQNAESDAKGQILYEHMLEKDLRRIKVQ